MAVLTLRLTRGGGGGGTYTVSGTRIRGVDEDTRGRGGYKWRVRDDGEDGVGGGEGQGPLK